MRTISELTEYLFGTSSAPARDASVHERTEHRHWNRRTQSWVDHDHTEQGEQAA
jgi:hypothetical protein